MDLAGLEKRLQTSPWVERAVVTRRPPDKLEIRILERTPVAEITGTDARKPLFMDKNGQFFTPGKFADEIRLPKLAGIADTEIKKGTLSGENSGILDFLALISKGYRILTKNNIESITLLPGGAFTVKTATGSIPVRFSRGRPVKAQLARAEKILYHLYTSGKYAKVARVELDYGRKRALAVMKN